MRTLNPPPTPPSLVLASEGGAEPKPVQETGKVLPLVRPPSPEVLRTNIVEILTQYVRERLERVLKKIPAASQKKLLKQGTVHIECKTEREGEEYILEAKNCSIAINMPTLRQAGKEAFLASGGNLVPMGEGEMSGIELLEFGIRGMIELVFPEEDPEEIASWTTITVGIGDGKSGEEDTIYYEDSRRLDEMKDIMALFKKKNGNGKNRP